MTRPHDLPCACCARCGARLAPADRRRSVAVPVRVSSTGAVLAWGVACPVCQDIEPEAPLCLEDLF
jgi:hypothetical protein